MAAKINRSRKVAQGLARRTRPRNWFATLVFLWVGEDARIWAHKIFTWKHLTIWRPVLLGFSQSTECLISDLHPELLSRSAACSGHDIIFVETAGKCQLPVSRVHIFDHALGAFHAHCAPQCWEGSFQVRWRFHWLATQGAVIGPGLVSSKSLWTIPVLLASWSRKIFPLVASSHI